MGCGGAAVSSVLHVCVDPFGRSLPAARAFSTIPMGFLLKWTVALLIVMPGPFVAGAQWYGANGVAFTLVFICLAMVWMAREALQELNLSAKRVTPLALSRCRLWPWRLR